MRIAFVFNLKKDPGDERQAEWDSPETIDSMARALEKKGSLVRIPADKDVKKKIEESSPDIVFNYAEGEKGEEREAEIPFLLEELKIPYTGSGPETMVNCLNKAKTKTILRENGIRTANFAAAPPLRANNLRYPCIVKPLYEGSSIGIRNGAIARTREEAEKLAEEIFENFSQPAIIEEFLPGREFTVGIIGNKEKTTILPTAEINHEILRGKLNPILSYEAKWVADTPETPLDILLCPAEIDETLQGKIENTALGAYRALACRDWCRVDIRLDKEGEPNVLELNPIPGMLPDPGENSSFPAMARAAGISYEELIAMVLSSALERLPGGNRP